MSAPIRRRVGVDDDIAGIALFLHEQNEVVALHFIDAVQATLKALANAPGVGSRKQFVDPRLQDVRSWWVPGFRNYLIFYLPLPNGGIDVLAVVHGARDTERILTNRT